MIKGKEEVRKVEAASKTGDVENVGREKKREGGHKGKEKRRERKEETEKKDRGREGKLPTVE